VLRIDTCNVLNRRCMRTEDEKKGANRSIDHLDILASLLSRAGVFLPVFPVQNCPSILVQLDGNNDHLTGVYADGSSSTIRLVALHTVNVDDPFLTVHLRDFPFPTFICPPDDPDLVIFADW